jgi:hypothetical protein
VRTLHLVPQGLLKLGSGVQPSLRDLSCLLIITQDYVLGYSQPFLRDLIGRAWFSRRLFSPAALFPSQFGFGRSTLPLQHSTAPEVRLFAPHPECRRLSEPENEGENALRINIDLWLRCSL